MGTRWLGAGLAVCVAAAACGKSPPQQVGQELEQIASFARTTQLTARQWRAGGLPAVYATQMARITGKSLRRSTTRPIWQQTSAEIRDTALGDARAGAALADRLGAAVRADDRDAAAEIESRAARLAEATRQLHDRVSPR